MGALQQHLQEQGASLKLWFPLYHLYKESGFRKQLQNSGHVPPSTNTPEARIAADFRRILEVMSPDSRRRVGFFVSSLLGLKSPHQAQKRLRPSRSAGTTTGGGSSSLRCG